MLKHDLVPLSVSFSTGNHPKVLEAIQNNFGRLKFQNSLTTIKHFPIFLNSNLVQHLN